MNPKAKIKRAGRIKATLCTWCAEPAEEGKRMCREHLDRVIANTRRKAKMQKAQDLARLRELRK